ncbi:MAG: alanine dehydrogenase [Mariprofundus sp.]|nr:alanine dehydrogenase [Mariprofundus sp.]
MRIGVPREIKNHEHRVAMIPAGVSSLVPDGHQVLIQASAGVDSGFPDNDYIAAGACMVKSAKDAWACDLVVKVKEPLASEYIFLRPNLALVTFLHLAAVPKLADVLLEKKVCAIGYETVQLDDGSLPILSRMSQVAGRVAAQLSVRFLQKENGTPFSGKGILAGGVAGSTAARVLILGGGNVGLNAAESLAGLGANVVVLEASQSRVHSLQASLHENISMEHFSFESLHRLLPDCDILIGAALIPGQHTPELLKRDDVREMQAGSVFIDVSIDQGGISETSRPTTYETPVYVEEGVIHCCLPNLPGSVPLTSTMVLTDASLPYIQLIANHGIDGAARLNVAISRGINIRDGKVLHQGVAESLRMRYK